MVPDGAQPASLTVLFLLLVAGFSSWVATGATLRYLRSRSVVDLPNDRSSHTVPKHRGGGLAIGGVAFIGIAVAAGAGWIPLNVAVALIGGGLLVGGVGWLEDLRGVSVEIRVAVHFFGATLAVIWLGGFPAVTFAEVSIHLGHAGSLLAIVGLVWLVNLYNFMDGIDGLAAGEAVSTGIAGGALLLVAGEAGLAAVAFLIAGASGGFLVWNWSPAKLFMGDVGSGLLGFLLGVLALASERAGAVPLVLWILLIAVFVFDATVTLVRRVLRREPWYAAHRTHAYQRAVQAGWSHGQVASIVLVLNMMLAAMAAVSLRQPLWLPATLTISVGGLAVIYLSVERMSTMARHVPPTGPDVETSSSAPSGDHGSC
jgi:Fuc2NAc and GlcNAc transferase